MIATAVGTHVYWITSRAAGTVALILSGASVGVGLMISGRIGKVRGPDLRVTHEALSLATIAAIILHAAALLGDSFFHPSVADLLVPFQMNYKEPYMWIGIVSGWGMVIFGLSYYARERIGIARWKVLHRFTAIAWILGVVHTLGEGTDAGQTWFLAVTALAVVPVVVLLAVRTLSTPGTREAGTAALP
jgi:methionine sulfoxide reductase heme-binding subunit